LQDTFGMLSFLRLIGLRIDGRMYKFLRMNGVHKMLCDKGVHALHKRLQ
jgi:hypothetical protein